MTRRPPRVDNPNLTHVGVYVTWAHDLTYCRASYGDWHVKLAVDPFETIDTGFRQAIERHAYDLAVRGPLA